MANDLKTALRNRRSYYDINASSPASKAEIKELVDYAVLNTPSAFNSQSARVVLLFGAEHKKLWEIVREALRKMVPADQFKPTDDKINAFAAGHGTILFYEDQAVVDRMKSDFPLYADKMQGFSMNSTGMLQHVVWMMLREVGLGATLQHYGNLIESDVAKEWGLDSQWRLIAHMPFGAPNSEPGPKDQMPLDQRVKVFG